MNGKEELEKSRCAKCSSQTVCYGYMGSGGSVFVPSGVFTVNGYRLRSFVCLNCGFVESYVPKYKLEKLKEKLEDAYED